MLIKYLALIPLWAFQISIQIITILDLGNALITCGFDAKHILLKICIDWIIDLTLLEFIEKLVSSLIYEISMILR